MRILVIAGVLAAAVGRAHACPGRVLHAHRKNVDPNPMYIASGGDVLREEPLLDPITQTPLPCPYTRSVYWVPPRPSMYIHLDKWEQFPIFENERGHAIPYVAVPTGIDSLPFRIDFLVDSGVINSSRGWKWEIEPYRVPTTRSMTVSRPEWAVHTWLEVDSDAALYLVELDDGATRVVANSRRRFEERPYRGALQTYMLDSVVKVVAVYADRRTQVIYEDARARDTSTSSSRSPIAFALVALLALMWLPRSVTATHRYS